MEKAGSGGEVEGKKGMESRTSRKGPGHPARHVVAVSRRLQYDRNRANARPDVPEVLKRDQTVRMLGAVVPHIETQAEAAGDNEGNRRAEEPVSAAEEEEPDEVEVLDEPGRPAQAGGGDKWVSSGCTALRRIRALTRSKRRSAATARPRAVPARCKTRRPTG